MQSGRIGLKRVRRELDPRACTQPVPKPYEPKPYEPKPYEPGLVFKKITVEATIGRITPGRITPEIRFGQCSGAPRSPVFNEVHAYTDASNKGGIGIMWELFEGNRAPLSSRVRTEKDNNNTEMTAIFFALLLSDPTKHLTVFTDSQTALDKLATFKEGDTGRLAALARYVMWLAQNRLAPTSFVKVKGHAGIEGNERAHELARQGRLCNGWRPVPASNTYPPNIYTLRDYANECGLPTKDTPFFDTDLESPFDDRDS
jgi:ribonuclease HI